MFAEWNNTWYKPKLLIDHAGSPAFAQVSTNYKWVTRTVLVPAFMQSHIGIGYDAEEADMQPGDLVYFTWKSTSSSDPKSHAAMVVGRNAQGAL